MTLALDARRVTHASREHRFASILVRDVAALLFFAVVIGLIYHGVLLGHASLKTNTTWPPGPRFVGDPTAGGPITLPLEKLVASAWRHFQLPVVDPYQGYGISLLANQGVPVFPLEVLLHILIPGNYSDWNVLLLLILAYGSYLLAASLGQSLLAALAVGTAASLAGVAPVDLNLGMLNPVAVLPFVLLSIRYLLDPRCRRPLVAGLGLASSLAMLGLSGFQEVLPLLAVVIIIFTVALIVHFRTLQVASRRLAVGGVSVVVGAIIGAIGYLPTLSVVAAGGGVNPPNSYLQSYPTYWLATMPMPSLTRGANPSWILGTPLLVLVLVLAVLISVRRVGAGIRWLVWPSAALCVIGILGYVNAGHVLDIFGFFPFDLIGMKRFLPFAWWLPWCLLLGVTISNASLLRWFHVAAAFSAAALVDLVTLLDYHSRLVATHQVAALPVIPVAVLVTLVFCGLFAVGAAFGRHLPGEFLMTAVVVASCVYYLPTNFFPAAGDQAITAISSTALPSKTNDYEAVFLNHDQLPVDTYSAQLFGPIEPKSYVDVVDALVPSTTTSNGLSPLWVPAPSLYFAKLDTRFLSVLRFMGVDRIVSPMPLSLLTSGPVVGCRASSSGAGICLAARGRTRGLSQPLTEYVYAIGRVNPLVDPATRVVPVQTNDDGVSAAVAAIRDHKDLRNVPVYVTEAVAVGRSATDASVVSRSATTQAVRLRVRARSAGVVVLRESYSPGMAAVVNGRQERAVPVDGGLWTALEVPAGTSRVTLNYVTAVDVVEFVTCGVGLVLLTLLWCVFGVQALRRRSSRRSRAAPSRRAVGDKGRHRPTSARQVPDQRVAGPRPA